MWLFQYLYGIYLHFVLIISVIFAHSENFICDEEAVFEKVNKGKPLDKDVISSHRVNSWFECSSKCLENLECISFSHLTESFKSCDPGMNCKISNTTSEYAVSGGQTWSTYEIRSLGVEICLTQRPCLNNGRCVRDSCEPDGYKCICNEPYHGKHCENANDCKSHRSSHGFVTLEDDEDDFDVVFASQHPEDSYIEMDNIITSDLREFTFSTWFKISPGLYTYHLLSYKTNITGNLEVFFRTSQKKGVPVQKIHVDILQSSKSLSSTPVNDNVWHHLGVSWHNSRGRMNILIDGSPRYIRKNVKKGEVIPGAGKFVIGQRYENSGFESSSGFLGQISGLNFWNTSYPEDMLELMAQSRDRLEGNILKWSNMLGNIFGDVQVVRPSNANNTNKGLNFDLKFESSSVVNYVLSPGPSDPFNEISICLWMRTTRPATFVSYNVEESSPFSFGIDATYSLFVNVSNHIYTSNASDASIIKNFWQYLCVVLKQEKNEVVFYHNKEENAEPFLSTSLSPGGTFGIGVTKNHGSYMQSFDGILTCLNIWSYPMTSLAVQALATGCSNINGDLLAWRNVPVQIVGTLLMTPNSEVYCPGFSLYETRSRWCQSNVQLNCGVLYARIGEDVTGEMMAWRCYCSEALFENTFAYKMPSTAYETKHQDLLAIV